MKKKTSGKEFVLGLKEDVLFTEMLKKAIDDEEFSLSNPLIFFHQFALDFVKKVREVLGNENFLYHANLTLMKGMFLAVLEEQGAKVKGSDLFPKVKKDTLVDIVNDAIARIMKRTGVRIVL